MTELVVRHSGGLRGCVRVPGDKSISHRALLLGAIAHGTGRVEGFLPSADCLATLRTLRDLGVQVEDLSRRDPNTVPAGRSDPSGGASSRSFTPKGDERATLIVHGRGLRGLAEPDDILNCARSGTTMRLLAGVLAC